MKRFRETPDGEWVDAVDELKAIAEARNKAKSLRARIDGPGGYLDQIEALEASRDEARSKALEEAADLCFALRFANPNDGEAACNECGDAIRKLVTVGTDIRECASRNKALEEAAELCDQNLDEYSGTYCTYRRDMAEAIRALATVRKP